MKMTMMVTTNRAKTASSLRLGPSLRMSYSYRLRWLGDYEQKPHTERAIALAKVAAGKIEKRGLVRCVQEQNSRIPRVILTALRPPLSPHQLKEVEATKVWERVLDVPDADVAKLLPNL